MLRYKTETRPGLVALYDIRPGNGAGPFLEPGARTGCLSGQKTNWAHSSIPATHTGFALVQSQMPNQQCQSGEGKTNATTKRQILLLTHRTTASISPSMLVMPRWSLGCSTLFSNMFFMMKITFSMNIVLMSLTIACQCIK